MGAPEVVSVYCTEVLAYGGFEHTLVDQGRYALEQLMLFDHVFSRVKRTREHQLPVQGQ
ncbi:hypothetical protein D3C75_1107390 [compost metagenome]